MALILVTPAPGSVGSVGSVEPPPLFCGSDAAKTKSSSFLSVSSASAVPLRWAETPLVPESDARFRPAPSRQALVVLPIASATLPSVRTIRAADWPLFGKPVA